MNSGSTGGRPNREDELIAQMKSSAAAGGQRGGGGHSSADALFRHDSPYSTSNNNANNGMGGGVMGPGGAVPPHASASAGAQASDNLRRALRTSEATNTTGYATMQSLGKQRETIQHSLLTVDSTDQNLAQSRQVVRNIRLQVYKEWLVKGCVIAILVALIVLIFWSKFIRKRS